MRIISPLRINRGKGLVYILKAGRQYNVYINGKAVKTLNVKIGDRILFGQDENNEEVFYVFKSNGDIGFKLRGLAKGNTLVCSSKEFVTLLKNTFKTEERISLVVSTKHIIEEGVKAYPMIQSN